MSLTPAWWGPSATARVIAAEVERRVAEHIDHCDNSFCDFSETDVAREVEYDRKQPWRTGLGWPRRTNHYPE